MLRSGLLAGLFAALVVFSGGLVGQETKKDEKKAEKKEDKKDDATKYKGTLPTNWRKVGLTDAQVQDVYKVQAKYKDEITKLKAKIAELEANMLKEERAVLTPEQKKRLEELQIGKDKDK
ncbi:Uncharacterized protein OS=Planctomyces maris DSM 8797 GN=PM8797T_26255 PE=4 SV=1 [Gemmata massiliana]|uniref:Uncharacterized protein n=1 Tax=Gemmata massiliana TaxID=1210884 RepID=A0A6P2D6C2_9BACT|nr:hypothetical protein [Gemmata massiliana]VTR94970.1 Uncharacterized protein OS=Planctomyces maris DSM 8797 GN=PM8797T_26255 PE=4 SV=1 [Gemmata massiliana]